MVWPEQFIGLTLLGIPTLKQPRNKVYPQLCPENGPRFFLKLLAGKNLSPHWLKYPTLSISCNYIKSWEIIPIQELPLYIGWETTWPLMTKLINKGPTP